MEDVGSSPAMYTKEVRWFLFLSGQDWRQIDPGEAFCEG